MNTQCFEALLCHTCLYTPDIKFDYPTLYANLSSSCTQNTENIQSWAFKCPFKLRADSGGKEEKKPEWEIRQKKERGDRRSQLEHRELIKKDIQIQKQAHKQAKQNRKIQKTVTLSNTCRHSPIEWTEAEANFDCETVESQENRAEPEREWRNVLKLGHSLREEEKEPVNKRASARQDWSVNFVCIRIKVRIRMCMCVYVCYTLNMLQTVSNCDCTSKKTVNIWFDWRFRCSLSPVL